MKSKSSYTNHRRAFTLVELLVVLVIVAALSALGFMGATRALKSASKSKSMANVRQLVSATQIFSSDNNSAVMDFSRTVIDGQKRN
jgi:prepilin-type N-terminal cleavage/methylation domain-containing protein